MTDPQTLELGNLDKWRKDHPTAYCGFCGEEIGWKDKRCKHCRADLSRPVIPQERIH